MKTLYLVDISSFIFRAYYAIRPLSAPDGTPVNAVYGVVSMMSKLIEKHKPDHLIVCNDRAEKGFRNEIFPEYKANRSAPPEDLVPQFDLIKEFIKTYPIKAIDKPGYEADDIIATIVHKYRKDPEMKIYIVSSDKDLMQLVGDNVFIYDTMKEKVSGEKEVIEKFGVPPDKVIDVQSLSGDSVDNIPGIPGVGPKTATQLIQKYGSLDGVFENSAEITGKLGEKVRAEKDKAMISKKLVTLVHDVDLNHLDWDDMVLSRPNVEKLNSYYHKLNFKKLVQQGQSSLFEEATPVEMPEPIVSATQAHFVCIDDVEALKNLVERIHHDKVQEIAFDTETDALDAHQANLVGISLCWQSEEAYYIPVGHKDGKNIALDDVREILVPILKSTHIAKLAQNAKFDINVLAHHGIEVTPVKDDTMIASYLVNPDAQHNLDALALKYMNYTTMKFTDVVEKGKTFADVDTATATRYSAEDAWVAFELNQRLKPEIQKYALGKVYSEIEIPLVPVLARMEQIGVLIDQEFLAGLNVEFTSRLKALETKIHELAGHEFNINSTKQLGEILFNELNLPVIKKNKTGPSTDVDVLTELCKYHELPQRLLEFRTLSKLLSTYVEQLKNLINPQTGRVHTSYNQTIAATGRLSSTEPNLQNIPIKTEEGRRIRAAFVAPKDHVILSADYSQIELRLLAAFSGDPQLIEAYKHNQDIHAKTASRLFDIPLDKVDSAHRSIGKTINFGVIYGQSPFGLSKQLDVPVSEAKRFIDGFYREFSHVETYREEVLNLARKHGFVTTYLGRRRMVPDINSRNKMVQQNAERVAFNTVFQGTAADLIKKAMIEIDAYLTHEKLKSKMILQVHDELIFEVPKDELDHMRKKMPEMMSGAFDLKVPLIVDCSYGKNWAEAD